jgi:hypothetical protein
VCLVNDLANGDSCSGGTCSGGQCIGSSNVCPAATVNDVGQLPFTVTWNTVGGTEFFGGACNEPDMPDFAVAFIVPQDGTYRFSATGLAGLPGEAEDADSVGQPADSVVEVATGNCDPEGVLVTAVGGAGTVSCNDDITDGVNLDSSVDVPLTAGQVMTVYASELGEGGGGSGTLTIELLP